ncbi:MAG: hypothetical protein ACT4O0_03105 [Pseudonocardia sp.]
MPSVGVLILFSIGGVWMCVKARAAGPAAVFAVLALVLFVSTPVGSGLPGAIATLFSAVDSAATPALTDTQTAGVSR